MSYFIDNLLAGNQISIITLIVIILKSNFVNLWEFDVHRRQLASNESYNVFDLSTHWLDVMWKE